MLETLLDAPDGHAIHLNVWLPAGRPRGVLMIAHGMSEYGARYAEFARHFVAQGLAVYAHDHRGHGAACARPGWFAAEGGWRRVVDDVERVRLHVAGMHPGVPVLLFGHSMGSYVARAYFLEKSHALDGLILSSPGYRQGVLARLMRGVAGLAGRLGQPDAPSRFMTRLVFGSFNLGFIPARTPLDWLSRDPAEVDRYIADPLCGGMPCPRMWQDLFGGIVAMEAGEKRARGLSQACAVYLLAGSRDPVSLGRLALGQIRRRYQAGGVPDVSLVVYPGGRHEMHNEINRDEVLAGLSAWIEPLLRRG